MELALISIAAFMSIIAVFFAALIVHRKGVAQRKLVALLRERAPSLPKPAGALFSNPHMSPALLEYKLVIEATAESMGESDREQALEGLCQPSDKGRARYLLKLLAESGMIQNN